MPTPYDVVSLVRLYHLNLPKQCLGDILIQNTSRFSEFTGGSPPDQLSAYTHHTENMSHACAHSKHVDHTSLYRWHLALTDAYMWMSEYLPLTVPEGSASCLVS